MTEFLVRMRRRGRSYGWIAKALGVSRATCIRQAEAAGLLRRAPRPAVKPANEPEPLGPPGTILANDVCHWIAGELDGGEWRMCGRPTVRDTSWCAHHFARATRAPAVEAEEAQQQLKACA